MSNTVRTTQTTATPPLVRVPAFAGAPQPAPAPTLGQDTFTRTATPAPATGDSTPILPRQQRYDLIVDLVGSRMYVVKKGTTEPVDSYLISPGTAKYPTMGDKFTIRRALTKAPWNPPKSDWAKDAKVTPGGLENPLGIFKLDLGGYSQYIHGTPTKVRKDLGRPASHGCIRMSNENVLQLFQQYAGVGTEVRMNRNAELSAKLKLELEASNVPTHKITDGAELLKDAAAGKAPKPVG